MCNYCQGEVEVDDYSFDEEGATTYTRGLEKMHDIEDPELACFAVESVVWPDGKTGAFLSVNVTLGWDEKIAYRVGDEAGVVKKPVRFDESFMTDINYCPICGRRLVGGE